MYQELSTMANAINHPPQLDLALNLLTNQRYCRGLHCYHSHMYRINKDKSISIDTIKQNVALNPQILLSCLLLAENRTSIFHGEIFTLQNGFLKPENPTLPRNLTLLDLHGPITNRLTRKIESKDLIQGILFPVFNLQSIGFLCPVHQVLKIDDKEVICNLHSLQFHSFPNKIIQGMKVLWSTEKNINSDYLQKRLKWSFSDLSPVLTDHKVFTTNINNPHALDAITQYFQTADDVSIGLWSTLAAFFVIIIIMSLALSCFFFPLFALRCCKGRYNLFRICLEKRLKTIELKRTGKSHILAEKGKMAREKELLEQQRLAQMTTKNNLTKTYNKVPTTESRQPTAPSTMYYSAEKESLHAI